MRALIDYLRGCPTGFDQGGGLCSNVREFIRRDTDYSTLLSNFKTAMQAATVNWQHFSGLRDYPVQSDNSYSVGRCFIMASTNDTMYDGEYGRRRIELANLIADELEKQLCKS